MTEAIGLRSAAIRDGIRRLEGSGTRTFVDPDPLVWEQTEGCRVRDADGTWYLDLYAGFAVATVGYCHPRVTEAIARQAALMTHCPSAFPSAARLELYGRLVESAPPGLDRVLPAITGAMANETAIQLARAATGRTEVISFSGAYLGRSLGVVGYAGKHLYHQRLGTRPDAHFLPYPDPYRSPWAGGRDPGVAALALLEELLGDPAAGVGPPACVVVEPVQGNGGAVVPPDGFLAGLRRLCDDSGTLLVFDEVQCGFGRTGRMWACDHEGVVPDLMTVGKGIGGGLPFAAVLGHEQVTSTWAPDTITSTFLTNVLSAAAACAAIDVVRDEGLVERSARLGEHALARLRRELLGRPHVGDVRGRGLFLAIELVRDGDDPDPDATAHAVRELRRRCVLVGRGGRFGNVLKLSPPLVIGEDELDEGLAAVVEVLA
ncbi:MAG TPA: aspartate aminotransferase family protein [Gaiellaceae bacterium]|nr:aspartate aminotransferase family protein [Gaiellaceae bacterium]